MYRRSLALAPVLAALSLAAPALAAPAKAVTAVVPAESVTATGSAEVKVTPANRHSNASIAGAVAAAENKAVPGALDAAHAKALLYAQDAGLTLGSVFSVSDAQSGSVFIGPYGPQGNIGPFGPGKYCGTIRRVSIKKVNGKSKVVRGKKVRQCEVPAYANATLTVTYSAT